MAVECRGRQIGRGVAAELALDDLLEVGGEVDGKVTLKEWETYYANLGASVDSDDHFELLIRNTFHISGGAGWCG